MIRTTTVSFVALVMACWAVVDPAAHAAEPGRVSTEDATAAAAEAVYSARCASCHDRATGRTPGRSALMFLTPNIIARTLEHGTMRPMATGLDSQEIRALAAHLSALPDRPPQSLPPTCGDGTTPPERRAGRWSTTSRDLENTRYQPRPGLGPEDVSKLELAWALAIPGGAPGPPVIANGALLLSTGAGDVASIDIENQCTRWSYSHGRIVRNVNRFEPQEKTGSAVVLFSDDRGWLTVLDAETGAKKWSVEVEDHPLSRAVAAPVVFAGRVYVAMSSIEDPLTHDPTHACCSSRGSVNAFDVETGEVIWKRYAIEESPQAIREATNDSPGSFGPAGASIYTPIAVDRRRARIYVSTAESYDDTNPAGPYSVIALDAASGARVWERQFLPEANERRGICESHGETDCRNIFSMGTSVSILKRADPSGDLLLVGQKSGSVYALDPNAGGNTVWERKLARGGDMGGVMYGLALDGERVFVPVSDLDADRPGDLVALEAATGKGLWRARQPEAKCSWGEKACIGAQVAAPTAIPGVVFTSAWDGFVRAHAVVDGRLLWQFDTGRVFEGVNGSAQGGQLGGYPIQVVDGSVYVTSGASSQGKPGNALLVFRVPGRWRAGGE
jgi:polyvinyl alcohol dehydrogenase (cytochrome)